MSWRTRIATISIFVLAPAGLVLVAEPAQANDPCPYTSGQVPAFTSGDDVIFGSAGDDYIFGGAGDDVIFGLGGNDVILGGPGRDLIYGGDCDDLLLGGQDDDILFGQGGDDGLAGDDGTDMGNGGLGHNQCDVEDPRDVVVNNYDTFGFQYLVYYGPECNALQPY